MPLYAKVVVDPEKYLRASFKRNPAKEEYVGAWRRAAQQIRDANAARRARGETVPNGDEPPSDAEIENEAARVFADRVEKRYEVGFSQGDPQFDECPDGLPNCRNCGDPAFAESCAAAGHCSHCGRYGAGKGGHGLASNAYLAEAGIELVEVPIPTEVEAEADVIVDAIAATNLPEPLRRKFSYQARDTVVIKKWLKETQDWDPSARRFKGKR